MKGKNGLFVLVALVALASVLFMLYRSASNRDLPDDEWFDFEHPTTEAPS
jgi:hypothetical protein